MANPKIKIKRSAIAGKVPHYPDNIGLGEFAINHADGKVFIAAGQAGVGVGTTVIEVGISTARILSGIATVTTLQVTNLTATNEITGISSGAAKVETATDGGNQWHHVGFLDNRTGYQKIKTNGLTYNPSTGKLYAGIGSFHTITGDLTGDVTGDLTGDVTAGQLSVTGVSTFQGNVYLGDGKKLYFGDGPDLDIYHNGGESYIRDIGSGNLRIETQGAAVVLASTEGEDMGKFFRNAQVELYYDNSKKFETIGTGATVTGDLYATTFYGNVTAGQLSVTGVSTVGLVNYEGLASKYSLSRQYSTYYVGSSYLVPDEYQKVVTIIPSGSFQNYQIVGRMVAQSGSNSQTINFNALLRANSLPDLSWNITYNEELAGSSAYITPQLWTKETTTAGFVLAFKVNVQIFGNVTCDFVVIPRSASQHNNVTLNTSSSSEQSIVDTGYTANDFTKVTSLGGANITYTGNVTATNFTGNIYSTGISTISGFRFPSTDGTSGQVLGTDGAGQLAFITASSAGSGTTITNLHWTVGVGSTAFQSPHDIEDRTALVFNNGLKLSLDEDYYIESNTVYIKNGPLDEGDRVHVTIHYDTSYNSEFFTATDGQTTFNLAATLLSSQDRAKVYLNGAKLRGTIDYGISQTVNLNIGATEGDLINISADAGESYTSASSGQTAFSYTSSGITASNLIVYQNGIRLEPTDYTVGSLSLVLTQGTEAGDSLDVLLYA